jgi:hypothetical protein
VHCGADNSMRIWSLNPKYLDTKGLVALWREALFAQRVLRGETKGYRHHPQLIRFRGLNDPIGALASYLEYVYEESLVRRYKFDHSKILGSRIDIQIPLTKEQLNYEWIVLKKKLEIRAPERYQQLLKISEPEPNPLFKIVDGDIEHWERVK